MVQTRRLTGVLAAAIVMACLCSPAAAQVTELTRQQRDILQALVAAVDAPATPRADVTWQTHVMRAADGSHYIALSITPAPAALPTDPIVVYVRLATRAAGTATLAERSLVREWLQGARIDPRLLPRSGMAIGEMPALGAGAIGARGGAAVGSADLQAMDLRRQRAREREEDEEKKRRAVLEGNSAGSSSHLPFEDFDVVPASTLLDGTRAIQRAVTSGPGDYDLFVAWAATAPARPPRVHLARQSITLSAAAPELGLSSIIIADQVGMRATAYTPLEQRSHPYSIGAVEIVPARDTQFTPNERLSAAFQIVNPAGDAAGKPDVVVNLRVARLSGAREEAVAALSPLTYNATSLPNDFDVRLGHPLIAALAVPLATIPRGTHHLVITVEDRIAKAVVSGRAQFTVVGNAASLLAEAPPLGPKFDLAAALDPSILATLVDRLAPPAPSPALARALSAARSGRFAELLIEDRVAQNEEAVRAVLTGLARLSLGDLGAIRVFESAPADSAGRPALDYLLGVARAAQGRDAEAIERWAAARQSGFSSDAIDRALSEAYLRRRDFARAAEIVRDSDAARDPRLIRAAAATRIGQRREAEAIAMLDALLAKSPDDEEARWLLVHALYSGMVADPATPRARFLAEAQRYVNAKGRHAALASEWISILTR